MDIDETNRPEFNSRTTNMMAKQFSVILVAIALNLNALPGLATADPVKDAEIRCKELEKPDLSQVRDAPTQIIEARMVGSTSDTPGYCQATGYVSPSVGFVLRMPEHGWNQKFIELGCGAFCGSTNYVAVCNGPLHRGYACIISDMGHLSSGAQALWAYNNLQSELDHAYRSAHVTALAGKAIVEHYYGRAPKKSYFWGNSTGGRQAMMEAQRFPWDFDGIIAGVPSLRVTGIHMNLLWANRALMDSDGKPSLSQADLDVLHSAVVRQCDLNDGIKDGLIGDPRACQFDPAKLLCTNTKSTECLTATQLNVVRKIYSGPVTTKGEQIYMPAALPGSEASWLDWFSRLFTDNPRATYNFVQEEFRYSAFQPNPGTTWKPEDFDFDRDYKRFGMADGLSASVNPDLREFKAAGGKLLAYAGWSDAAGMPLHTVDYYETVERTLGGRAATQEFFRLFMIPGMGHGCGAEGACVIDYLSYLEAWVEDGKAPNEIIGVHVQDGYMAAHSQDSLSLPLDPSIPITYARPVYPYPLNAIYKGKGDPSKAESFAAVKP
jgi:hypothetical protein